MNSKEIAAALKWYMEDRKQEERKQKLIDELLICKVMNDTHLSNLTNDKRRDKSITLLGFIHGQQDAHGLAYSQLHVVEGVVMGFEEDWEPSQYVEKFSKIMKGEENTRVKQLVEHVSVGRSDIGAEYDPPVDLKETKIKYLSGWFKGVYRAWTREEIVDEVLGTLAAADDEYQVCLEWLESF